MYDNSSQFDGKNWIPTRSVKKGRGEMLFFVNWFDEKIGSAIFFQFRIVCFERSLFSMELRMVSIIPIIPAWLKAINLTTKNSKYSGYLWAVPIFLQHEIVFHKELFSMMVFFFQNREIISMKNWQTHWSKFFSCLCLLFFSGSQSQPADAEWLTQLSSDAHVVCFVLFINGSGSYVWI